MLRRCYWAVFVAVIMFVGMQCSSGDREPSLPDLNSVERATSSPGVSGDKYLWGLWQVSIDTTTGEAGITQLRQGDLALNVLGFLEAVPLTNLSIDFGTLQIDSVNNYIGVDVILTHPLVTAEKVFTGFDVRGVVFGPEVRNADGWTAMMNPAEFMTEPFGYMEGKLGAPYSYANYSGDWFGYKYFCDGLDAGADVADFFTDEANLLKRGVFDEGEVNLRHYDLYFGGDYTNFMIFNYAVVASYNWPTGEPPYNMDDFDLTTGNVAEPFCGRIFNVVNNLAKNATDDVCGSFTADIEVWDWQGFNDVSVDLVSDILGEVTPQTAHDPGNSSKSAIYHITDVPGANKVNPNGDYLWFVCTDASETFGSSWFLALLSTGNPRYNDPVFTVFGYRTELSLNTNPLASATAIPLFPGVDKEVTFDASNSYDAETGLGALIFEWDFDNDGVYGDDTGMIVQHSFPAEGIYPVDVRVTDTCGASDVLDTKLSINVSLCGVVDAHIANGNEVTITSNFSVLPHPRFGTAFMTTGPYAGQAVMQSGPYGLGVFDADSAGNVTGTRLCNLRPSYYYGTVGPQTRPNNVLEIEVCPVDGYILVVTDTMYRHPYGWTIHIDKIEAYAPDGSGVVWSMRDTTFFYVSAIAAIDCDDNGDIWLVGGQTTTGELEGTYYLIRLQYQGSGKWSFNMNPSNYLDITNYLDAVGNTIIDMAVDYGDQRVYIMYPGTTGLGKLLAVDFSTGSPVYDPTYDVSGLFTNPIDIASYSFGTKDYWNPYHFNYAGIDIDHNEAASEKCRITCYARLATGAPQVTRLNHVGLILDRNNGTTPSNDFSINNDSDESIRHLTFARGTTAIAPLWDTPSNW